MANRNGAFAHTDAVRNALLFLESKGYTAGGDIHDDLANALQELESTAIVVTYCPEDVLSIADDLGLEMSQFQAEAFCASYFEGAPSKFQEYTYDMVGQNIEILLQQLLGKCD